MNNFYCIKKLIRDYCHLESRTFILSEGQEDQMVRKTEIEKDILSFFGLPLQAKYVKLLWEIFEMVTNTDDAVEFVIKEFQKQAQLFYQQRKQPFIQKLKDALVYHKEAFDVLPELEINVNLYTLFLYNEMLLGRKVSLEIIADELIKAKTDDYIYHLYKISRAEKLQKNNDDYIMLKEYGLSFLDEFVEWCIARRKPCFDDMQLNLAIRNEDAVQSLSLSFRLFLYYKEQGHSIEEAKKRAGLSNERIFKIVEYIYISI